MAAELVDDVDEVVSMLSVPSADSVEERVGGRSRSGLLLLASLSRKPLNGMLVVYGCLEWPLSTVKCTSLLRGMYQGCCERESRGVPNSIDISATLPFVASFFASLLHAYPK